jgi:cysteinyl-tRNA synthetase
VFPHHENEIAQAEALTGKPPFVRYWLHNGMLQLRGEKMSKSLGNLVTVEDFLAEHDADVLRLVVLSSHYGKPLAYDDEVVADAERALSRLRSALRSPSGADGAECGEATAQLGSEVTAARTGFCAAMDDDFNTAGALGHLFNLVRAINVARDAGVGGAPFAAGQAAMRELAQVLGLELQAPGATGAEAAPFIAALLDVRAALREQRQWAAADAIRDRLNDLGVELEDGAAGTEWRWAG